MFRRGHSRCFSEKQGLLSFSFLSAGVTGTAAFEFGILFTQTLVAAETGAYGIPVVEGHEAAVLLIASALNGMAPFGAAGRIGRFFQRGAVVTDGAPRLVMAGVAGDILVGAVVEGHRETGRITAAEHDGVFRILDAPLEVLCIRGDTPGQGDEEGKDEKRSHAQSPSPYGQCPDS